MYGCLVVLVQICGLTVPHLRGKLRLRALLAASLSTSAGKQCPDASLASTEGLEALRLSRVPESVLEGFAPLVYGRRPPVRVRDRRLRTPPTAAAITDRTRCCSRLGRYECMRGFLHAWAFTPALSALRSSVPWSADSRFPVQAEARTSAPR